MKLHLNYFLFRPTQPQSVDSLSLQHRLDLCHLEDEGQLDSLVTNKKMLPRPKKLNNIRKTKPDLSVFADQREKKSRAAEVQFVSPYQR